MKTIKGLTVTVSGTELKKLCLLRAKYHRDRVEFYEKTKTALPDEEDEMANSSNKKPGEWMLDKIAKHQEAADELTFIAGHLEAKAQYQLDRADLYRIGVTKQRY